MTPTPVGDYLKDEIDRLKALNARLRELIREVLESEDIRYCPLTFEAWAEKVREALE